MNNKKVTILFILIASLILITIGATFAYYMSTTDFENEFNTALYQTEATETFESPDNWMPGDTTPKTLTIKNTGNVNVKARVCLTEEWTSHNGDTLSNTYNGQSAAIINLTNTEDWTKKGNCYEYNDVLEPNDTTSTFMESVTFNSVVEPDLTCTSSTVGNTTTKTCSSSGDGYDNATYTLTLRAETVQANKASEVWVYEQARYVTTGGTVYIGQEIPIGSSFATAEEAMAVYENRPFYLKHVIEDGVVIESYVEFIVTEEMANANSGMTRGTYSLRGAGATYDETDNSYNNDSPYYETNKQALQAAFGASNCNDYTFGYQCSVSGLSAKAHDDGYVGANDGGNIVCHVNSDGSSYCDVGVV